MMAEKVTIGNCELWHGDCREILPTLPPCDLILTDPPYGIGEAAKQGMSRVRPTSKWTNPQASKYDEMEWDNCPADQSVIDAIVSAKAAIVWGGNYFVVPPAKCWLVWDKKTTGDFADCELAWTNLNKAVRKFEWLWSGFKKQEPEERTHPTQKPVKLMEWCIRHAPNPATVCDPFMGSGTTGVACARMGLQFTGIERERKYFDIACRRIEQAYAQPRLFEDAKVGAGDTAVQGDMLLPANV
jgi:site-specific DNA-methyltransferase (adenine-specific)/modification methylase